MFVVYSVDTQTTANSYISVEELRELTSKNIFLDASIIPEDNTECEKLLIGATSVFDLYFLPFSEKLNPAQSLNFPTISEDVFEIPDNIKLFICFTVSQIITDPKLYTSSNVKNAQVKKDKLDVIETEFFELAQETKWHDNLNSYSLKLLDNYAKIKGEKQPLKFIRG